MKRIIFLAIILASCHLSSAFAQQTQTLTFCDTRKETRLITSQDNPSQFDQRQYSYTISLNLDSFNGVLSNSGPANYTYRYASSLHGQIPNNDWKIPCGTDKSAPFFSYGQYEINPQFKSIKIKLEGINDSNNPGIPSNPNSADMILEGRYELDSNGQIDSMTLNVINDDMQQWFSNQTIYKRIK